MKIDGIVYWYFWRSVSSEVIKNYDVGVYSDVGAGFGSNVDELVEL